MRCALLFLLLLLGACTRPTAPPAPRLVATSEAEARALVERFFTDYAAGDVEASLSRVCEQDAPSRHLYRAFIERSQAEGSPFRITRFSVRDVQATWQGSEPYFVVVVAFPRSRGPGEIVHGYRVRARAGCIEQFLGGTAPDHGAPPQPPAAPPERSAPVDDEEEVIEL